MYYKDLAYNMTFTNEKQMESEDSLQREAPAALKQTLQIALSEERSMMGTIGCADVLSTHPETVSLCILPKEDGVNGLIQHKLIQAYCWENDIPVLLVDSEVNLRKILSREIKNSIESDVSCVIIKNKEGPLSVAETTLAKYYAWLIAHDVDPHPILQLPV
ncbi:hypothetical protein FSP39_020932 [Pinctada imbricata]|uniref:Ribosomal protein L7Ae/L30e/S12e/Gadd45 domain-containing protein n=1 Tax=Pinctada imbricata TaxID=66713 RepID=A0AA88XTI5_PINIB|nr:hypothetical protein FSP39_020932 [Pinctada imbricata]